MSRTIEVNRTMIEPNVVVEDCLWVVGLTQWRMFEYVMSGVYIKGGLTNGDIYTIDVEDYARHFGIEYNSAWKTLTENLSQSKIPELCLPTTIFNPEAEEDKLTKFFLYSSITYSPEQSATVDIRLAAELVYLYNNLGKDKLGYSKYLLTNTKYMDNVNSIRLYRILNKWKMFGKVKYSLEELKVKLGFKENQYERYGDFNSKVLVPALEDINKLTGICVTMEPLRGGKKVIGLMFTIARKSKVNIIGESYEQS